MSFVSADPYTAVALAAQRRARFLAEATHARQLNQLPSGRHETRVSRFVLAVRGDAQIGSGSGYVMGSRWLAPPGVDVWRMVKERRKETREPKDRDFISAPWTAELGSAHAHLLWMGEAAQFQRRNINGS